MGKQAQMAVGMLESTTEGRLHKRATDGAAHLQEHTASHFLPARLSSEEFVTSYLNPVTQPGCRQHMLPDCLCDVDVSLTADLSWDKPPRELHHVDTVEKLVLAGANVWANYDLIPTTTTSVSSTVIELAESGELDEVIEAVRGNASWASVERKHPFMRQQDFQFLRRVLGVAHASRMPQAVTDRAIELMRSGVRNYQIRETIKAELGYVYADSSLARLRGKLGLRDVFSGNHQRTPVLYDWKRIYAMADSGMSYREICNVMKAEGQPHNFDTVRRQLTIVRKREQLAS